MLLLHLSAIQDAPETARERNARVANTRAHHILSSIEGELIVPSEFVGMIDTVLTGPRQRIEDDAFVRLYRGYSASDLSAWVCAPSMDTGFLRIHG